MCDSRLRDNLPLSVWSELLAHTMNVLRNFLRPCDGYSIELVNHQGVIVGLSKVQTELWARAAELDMDIRCQRNRIRVARQTIAEPAKEYFPVNGRLIGLDVPPKAACTQG